MEGQPRRGSTGTMPELPEGTINAFIQNKNLAKYGLLKDNEGGFLAENFVDYQLIDRHETLEEIVAVGTTTSQRRTL